MEYTEMKKAEMKKAEMKNTVFGEVLAEFLEARDMPPVIPYVRGLVEGVNLDAELLIQRIEGTSTEHPGDEVMAALSDRLELTGRERRELAFAFTYEMRLPERPEIPELSDAQEECLQSRIRSLDAISTAIAVVEDNPQPNERVQAETLEELRMLEEEANMEVKQTKKNYGFKDY